MIGRGLVPISVVLMLVIVIVIVTGGLEERATGAEFGLGHELEHD